MFFKHELVDIPNLKTDEVDGVRHYLFPNGDRYPSVTTILDAEEKPKGLTDWIERVGVEEANRISTLSANKGKAVHTICENYLNNLTAPQYGAMPDAIGVWFKMRPSIDQIKCVYAIEQCVYSHKHKFAGKADAIGLYQDTSSIIDFKTNKTDIDDTPEKITGYALQLSAYSIAWEELTGQPINQGVLIFGSTEHGCRTFKMALKGYKKKFLDLRAKYDILMANSDEGIRK